LYVYKLQHFPYVYIQQDVASVSWDNTEDWLQEVHETALIPEETWTTDKETQETVLLQHGEEGEATSAAQPGSSNKSKPSFWTTQQQKYATTNNLVTLFQASGKQHKGKNTTWLPSNFSHSWLVIKQPRQFRKDNHRPYWNRQKGNRKWRNGQWNKQYM
jgi:hypothetical protein